MTRTLLLMPESTGTVAATSLLLGPGSSHASCSVHLISVDCHYLDSVSSKMPAVSMTSDCRIRLFPPRVRLLRVKELCH